MGKFTYAEFPAYSDTGYSDSFDISLMAFDMSKMMWLVRHLLTLTLFSLCSEVVMLARRYVSLIKVPQNMVTTKLL